MKVIVYQTRSKCLTDTQKENNFEIAGHYVDDGWSGTNFERPDFKRMVADIEKGLINIVIVKDLSRLGRNNAMVALYTEMIFSG